MVSCGKKMNNDFIINASPEILRQLKVNILYMDNRTNPLITYYNKGERHTHQDEVSGYVVYINYNDEWFLRASCDRNPEYFEYSAKKSIAIERREEKLYVNVIFLREQEEQEKRYDISTQMLSLQDALVKYQDDFHPVAWRKHLSLEDKLRLTLSP